MQGVCGQNTGERSIGSSTTSTAPPRSRSGLAGPGARRPGRPMNSLDDELTLRDALARYLAANGLGDGGYRRRWVKLGERPFPTYFPNSAAYARAMRLHDLHHVVTGYRTDGSGEFEIAAWELGSGCASHVMAWIFDLFGMGVGGMIWPRATLSAYRAGLDSRNLFIERYDEVLLDQRVGDVRARLGLPVSARRPAISEVFRFAGWSVVGAALLAIGLALFGLPLALAALAFQSDAEPSAVPHRES